MAINRRLFFASGIALAAALLVHEAVAQNAELKLGRSMPTLNTPFFTVLVKAASAEATSLGGSDAGGAQILVNNAGLVGTYASLTDVSVEDWHSVIAVNQTGVFYGMRVFIPQMLGRGGSVVNVSSIWGAVGAAGVAPYTASKGAVTQMSKNGALTYAKEKVRVNSVYPGLIATPMIAAQDPNISADVVRATPMGRIGEPGEVAAVILFLASDEASYVTGAQFMVDGGYTAQ